MNPYFSIITVCLNDLSGLTSTRDSLYSQNEKDFEWIVIDGASKDGSVEMLDGLKYPNFCYISEADGGIYDAMNKGIRLARGDWLWFMNAGDVFYRESTLRGVKLATEHVDICYGEAEVVAQSGEKLGLRSQTLPHVVPDELSLKDFRHGMLISHQAFAVRRSIVLEYDLSYKFGSDYDWMLRIIQRTTSAVKLGILAIVVREGATTQNWHVSQMERFRIMSKHFGLSCALVSHAWIGLRRVKHEILRLFS